MERVLSSRNTFSNRCNRRGKFFTLDGNLARVGFHDTVYSWHYWCWHVDEYAFCSGVQLLQLKSYRLKNTAKTKKMEDGTEDGTKDGTEDGTEDGRARTII